MFARRLFWLRAGSWWTVPLWWGLSVLAAGLIAVLVGHVSDPDLRKGLAALLAFAMAVAIAVVAFRHRRLKGSN